MISNYIKSGIVELFDYRGKPHPQLKAYNDCYQKYNKIYKWLIFYDVDEFIYLKDFNNLKTFLNDDRFKKCYRIKLNWIHHTDNNLLYYDNRTVKERFPERESRARGIKKGKIASGIKSILWGGLKININCVHNLFGNIPGCNGFGKYIPNFGISVKESDFEYYYIDHYATKSTEEFIQKLKRTDAYNENDINLKKIDVYFIINKITKEKLDLIERETKYNMSKYREQIK